MTAMGGEYSREQAAYGDAELASATEDDGRDLLEGESESISLDGYAARYARENVLVQVLRGFESGTYGDILDIHSLLSTASGYEAGTNPFAKGYVRLVQDGEHTLVEYDWDGAGDAGEWTVLALLENVDATTVTHVNFQPAFSPTGAGVTIEGGDGYDVLRGSAEDDVLSGGGGTDDLFGDGGDDVLNGGEGADYLGDYSGSNTINGGAGDDYIYGIGYGRGVSGNVDIVTGGDGRDRFVIYHYDADETETVVSLDIITDFTTGVGGDVLDISGLSGSTLQDYERWDNPFASGHLRLVADGQDTLLQLDIDAGGEAARWQSLVRLIGVSPDSFVAANFYPSFSQDGVGLTLTGTDTADLLAGAGDDDTLSGLGGDDTLRGDVGDDGLDGGAGNDRLDGGIGDDRLSGGDGDDIFVDYTGDNVIDGGAGNDTFEYIGFTDYWSPDSVATMTGGAGRDTYRIYVDADRQEAYESDPDVVTDFAAGAEGDVIDLASFLAWQAQGYEADSDPFATGYIQLIADGEDTLVMITPDPANEDAGAVAILRLAGIAPAQLTADNFFPAFSPFEDGDPQEGTENGDILIGTAAGDTIDGLGGDDQISGRGGDDVLDGSDGNDRLLGEAGDDLLEGGAGNDSLDGGVGDDTLMGGEGNDFLYDYQGKNIVHGGAGDDTFYYLGFGGDTGTTGSDTLTGGEGRDTYDIHAYTARYAPTLVRADVITDFTAGAGGDILLLGSVVGYLTNYEAGKNPFVSGHLRVVDQNGDTLVQVDWDGSGTSGSWTTLARLRGVASTALVAANFAPDWSVDGTGATIVGDDTANSLVGTANDDVILGLGGSDYLYGQDGDDKVEGGAGADYLEGGRGDDMLDGGEGNDQIYDSGGNNTLIGGAGDDVFGRSIYGYTGAYRNVMTGGDGRDTFRLHSYDVRYSPATQTADTVTDFKAGAGGDLLDLSGVVTYLTGYRVGENPFLSNHVRLQSDGADTLVQVDWDGTGTAGWATVVRLQGVEPTALTYQNFTPDWSPDGTGVTIVGTASGEYLSGTGNDDLIQGLGGSDGLYGLDGNDKLEGGAGADNLDGGRGDDTLEGGDDGDYFYDYQGANAQSGGAGDDVFYNVGYGGSSTAGVDTLTGGAGRDTYAVNAYDLRYSIGTLKVDIVTDFLAGAGGDRIDLANVVSYLANYIAAANPFLSGHLRLGADGDDTLVQIDWDGTGIAGWATILRLKGVAPTALDANNFSQGWSPDGRGVTLEGTENADNLNGSVNDDVLRGLGGNDYLYGQSGNDKLEGGAGADYLDGGSGNDTLDGGDGNDALVEYQGTNVLGGGAGDDTFNYVGYSGGYAPGVDTLTGGAGRDTYRLYSYDARYSPTSARADVITDFKAGVDGDMLDLAYTASYLANYTYGDNPFLTGHVRLVADGDDTLVQVDWDGTGSAGWSTMVRLQGLAPTALNYDNFTQGWSPDGRGKTVVGTDASEFLYGTAGTDTLQGMGGNDYLYGYGGNDMLEGGAGADVIEGGAGDDTIDGGDGNDTLWDYQGANVLKGGAGDDTFGGVGFSNSGEPAGVDTITGGAGRDTYRVDASTARYSLASVKTDIITDFAAGASGDILDLANAVAQFTNFRAGDNPFLSGHVRLTADGADTLVQVDWDGTGTAGWATLVRLQDIAPGTLDHNNFSPNWSPDGRGITLVGDAGGNTLSGTANADLIQGLGGNDLLYGDAGNDTLEGGDGIDVLWGGEGDDRLSGGDGADTFYDVIGLNTFDGGAGADTFSAVAEGGERGGSDRFTGGEGRDTYQISTYDLRYNPTTLAADTISDFATGKDGDMLSLTDIHNYLLNYSYGTNPFVSGHLRMRAVGADTLLEANVDGSSNGVWRTLVRLEKVAPSSLTAANINPGWSFDGVGATIVGDASNNYLTGTFDSDTISGLGGNDTLIGDAGNDVLDGGEGADYLDGVEGDDRLTGGAGDDYFYDYSGTNVLNGGGGNDRFDMVGYSGGLGGVDTLTGGEGRDTYGLYGYDARYSATNLRTDIVTDFTTGAGGDVLDLSSIFAYLAGFVTEQNPFATGHLRLLADGEDTLVQMDWDARGTGGMWQSLVRLRDVDPANLTAENFSPQVTPPAAGVTVQITSAKVDENAPGGRLVGTLAATGTDATGTYTFTLVDDAGGRFRLVGDRIEVADGASLDYEAATSHRLRVRATDTAGTSVENTLIISLNDVVADFAVTQVAVGVTELEAGRTVDLEWTVANRENAAFAGGWVDNVYLDDPNTPGLDHLLASLSTDASIAANGTVGRVHAVTLPLAVEGAYRFVVMTDAGGRIAEGVSGEEDNTGVSAAIEVAAAQVPNLIVSDVTTAESAFAGREVEVRWTVTNTGDAPTSAAYWYDGIWLSEDDKVGAGDIQLGDVMNPAYLAPGEAYQGSSTVRLPANLQGKYRILVQTDRYGQLPELTHEDDNVAASSALTIDPIPLSERPDLKVASVAAPDQGFSGQRLPITVKVVNVGDGVVADGEAAQLGGYTFWSSSSGHGSVRDILTHFNGTFGGRSDENTIRVVTRTTMGAAPEWVEQVFMSTDATLDAGDRLLQTTSRDISYFILHDVYRNYSYVAKDAAGNSYRVSGTSLAGRYYELAGDKPAPGGEDAVTAAINVTLPEGISGDYYFFVRITPSSWLNDVYDSNNLSFDSAPTRVRLTPPPDLEMEKLTFNGEAVAGHAVTLDYSVLNAGATAPNAGGWYDRFYLSRDTVLDGTDTLLTQVGRWSTVQPGDAYGGKVSLILPVGIEGTWHVIGVADGERAVFELNRDNNVAASAGFDIVSRPADLVVTAAAVSGEARAGTPLLLEWSVRNQGTGDSIVTDWQDYVVLSRDEVLGNGDDRVIATFGHAGVLNPGESYVGKQQLVLPQDVAGAYRLFVVTDGSRQVFEETAEGNNYRQVHLGIGGATTIDVAPVQRPDLRVTKVDADATATSGGLTEIHYTITNAGDARVTLGGWTDRIVLSGDDVLGNTDDVVVGSVYRASGLEKDASYIEKVAVKLPVELAGRYTVFVQSDAGGSVAETAEDNNARAAAATIDIAAGATPDLLVTSVSGPEKAVAGQLLTIDWSLANKGAADAPARGYQTFYLSRDTVLDRTSDIYLGHVDMTTVLATGATVDGTQTFKVAAGLGGRYYVLSVADSGNAIYERGGEANNVSVSARRIDISLPAPVDLVAGVVTVPGEGLPGAAIAITYHVSNQSGSTAIGQWQDNVYLSRDDKWDASDLLFARATGSGSLATGASYTNTVTGQLPGVLSGDYHIIVRTDVRNQMPETDETNNVSASVDSVKISVEELILGTPDTGRLEHRQTVYYKVEVDAGETLRVAFDSASDFGRSELFVSYGELPSRSGADFRFDTADAPDQAIIVPNTRAGTYYVMAYNDVGFTTDYAVTADVLGFEITDIATDSGSNRGHVTIKIEGAQLTTATAAALVDAAGTERAASAVLWKSATEVWATFDLRGLSTGAYDVKLGDGASVAVLEDGFTVNSKPEGQVVYGIETPPALRPGQTGTVRVYYRNEGETDVAAPLLQVSGNAKLKLPGDADFGGTSMQLLGINAAGPAGVLPPGAEGSFQLTITADFTGAGTIRLGVSALDADTPMDWATLLADARSVSMADAAWAQVLSNLTATLGDTAGEYGAALAEYASRLDLLEGRTGDVARLFGMALNEATVNGSLLDAAVPGVLGRSREFAWDIAAMRQADGDVVVRMGDAAMRFEHDGKGGFVDRDGATLAVDGGRFELAMPDGTRIEFGSDGRFTTLVDANGNTLSATYAKGLLTKVAGSDGATLDFAYDARGRLTSVTDESGRIDSYGYDATGEYLNRVTTPAGTTRFDYITEGPARGSVYRVTGLDGATRVFEYDERGRLAGESLAGGAERVTYAYDDRGGVTITDAQSRATRVLTDDNGLVAQVEDALGRVIQMRHDADGRLVGIVNPDGTTGSFEHDDAGRLVEVLDALGNTVRFDHDALSGRLTAVADGNGNPIGYDYDDRGNLTRITYADGSFEAYAYDAKGRLAEATNRRGQATTFAFDEAGRLTGKTFADGSTASFGYDAGGRLILAEDADSGTTYAYDAAGRLAKVTDGDGRFLAYEYDAAGRRASMTDQDGREVHYGYDAKGRLAELTDENDARIAAYNYDAIGRLSRGDNGNGTYTTYDYDAAGQLVSLVNHRADDSVNSRFDYTYDDMGRRTSVTTLDGTTDYEYDAIGQLTGVTLPGGRHIEYRYDAAGNRTTVTDDGVSEQYAANDLNQYVTAGGTNFTYDKDGNMLSRTVGEAVTTYAYDSENRLVSVKTGDDEWRYEYDALGNRIASTLNGERTEFQFDPLGLGNVVGAYGASSARYVHGLGLEATSGAGGARYYDFDAIGSTTGLTNADGAYGSRASYLPFGETLSAAGASDPFGYVGQFGVQGDGSGLLQMRARYYDAQHGRFTQTDPLGVAGGVNVNAYVVNDPVNFIDPEGLIRWLPGSTKAPDVLNSSTGILTGVLGVVGGAALLTGAVAVGGPLAIGIGTALVVKSLYGIGANSYNLGNALQEREGAALYGDFADLGWNANSRRIFKAADMAIDLAGMLVTPANLTKYLPSYYGKNFEALGNALQLTQAAKTVLDAWTGGYDDDDPVVQKDIPVVAPRDPNDILGPKGHGDDHWVAATEALPYTVRFENVDTATAPAQQVTITLPLDGDLDPRTFRLGDFGWGDIVIDVPDNASFYTDRLDFVASHGFLLDVIAGIDVATGEAFWTLTTIDPETGEIPEDPRVGFLPPNVDKGTGEGFVNYTVRPDRDVATGTVVEAGATIVFSTQEPIDTPVIFNTLDADAPESAVEVVPENAERKDARFTVRWGGTDEGAAIRNFDVYVSDNGGAYRLWLGATEASEAVFDGEPGHRYAFYTRARDHVGNLEAAPATPDLVQQVAAEAVRPDVLVPAVAALTPPAAGRYGTGDTIEIAVRFTEAVLVAGQGAPGIALTIGDRAITAGYAAGTGTDTLVFRHVVKAGDFDVDGIVIASKLTLGGATLTDKAGNALASDALFVPSTAAILVDNAPATAGNIADQDVRAGQAFALTLAAGLFTDADAGDTLIHVARLANGAALPAWLAFDSATRTFSGMPADGDSGEWEIVVVATDTAGASAQQRFTLAVAAEPEPEGQAPTDIALSSASVAEDAAAGAVIGTLSATDPDGGTLTFLLVDDAGGRFGIEDGRLVIAAGAALDYETAASHQVVVRVTDDDGLSFEEALTIAITDVDEATGPEETLSDSGDVFEAPSDAGWDVFGLGGDDRLVGGAGDDRLFGGADNDVLTGGNGSDRMVGGSGNDTMTGGAGADIFVFDTLEATGLDRITDFGRDDELLTTRPIYDSNGDGFITFGRNRVLDLVGGGQVSIASEVGKRVQRLVLEGTRTEDDVTYYVYALE